MKDDNLIRTWKCSSMQVGTAFPSIMMSPWPELIAQYVRDALITNTPKKLEVQPAANDRTIAELLYQTVGNTCLRGQYPLAQDLQLHCSLRPRPHSIVLPGNPSLQSVPQCIDALLIHADYFAHVHHHSCTRVACVAIARVHHEMLRPADSRSHGLHGRASTTGEGGNCTRHHSL